MFTTLAACCFKYENSTNMNAGIQSPAPAKAHKIAFGLDILTALVLLIIGVSVSTPSTAYALIGATGATLAPTISFALLRVKMSCCGDCYVG